MECDGRKESNMIIDEISTHIEEKYSQKNVKIKNQHIKDVFERWNENERY
jgi:hypothetical protein